MQSEFIFKLSFSNSGHKQKLSFGVENVREKETAMQDMESIRLMEASLRDVAEYLEAPNKSKPRVAALKLHRVSKIASILAFTIYRLP